MGRGVPKCILKQRYKRSEYMRKHYINFISSSTLRFVILAEWFEEQFGLI
jgi:hypothetical protein